MLDFTPSQWYLGYALRKVEDNIPRYARSGAILRYTTRVSWEAYAPDEETCKFEASTLQEIKDLIKGDLL